MRVIVAVLLVLLSALPTTASTLDVIKETVAELSAHYGVPAPSVDTWGERPNTPGAYRGSGGVGTIYVYDGFVAVFDRLPLIEDSIWRVPVAHFAAHEFRHHIQHLQGRPISESEAISFAVDYTGFSHRHIGDLMLAAICLSGWGGDPWLAGIETHLRSSRPSAPAC